MSPLARALLLLLAGVAVVSAEPVSAPAEPVAPPAVSAWDRVPLNIHFAKRRTELTEAELDFLAARGSLITLEKGHGAGPLGSTEAGVAYTARRLKQRNPEVKVLFYLNAFINWPGYESYGSYREEWTLRTEAGAIVKHTSGTPRPDPTNAEFREWWSELVAAQMGRGPVDGVFVDALPQAFGPGLSRRVGPEKAAAILGGLREMVALTKRKIGPEKILLANAPGGENFRAFLDWEGVDGVMIEHFAAFRSDRPEHIRSDLENIAFAGSRGKFVVLKGWPGFSWLDEAMMKRPQAELLQLARERITFPLACFLVTARPGSLFCYSWGYTERHGTLDAYPALERPLGPPLGDAKREGWTYRREFARASVFVDVETTTARIDWKP